MLKPVAEPNELAGGWSTKMKSGMKNTTCEQECWQTRIKVNILIRADFMDDEYIQDLLEWVHPYISNQSVIEYTEKENMEMLRLPRRECQSFHDKSCYR